MGKSVMRVTLHDPPPVVKRRQWWSIVFTIRSGRPRALAAV